MSRRAGFTLLEVLLAVFVLAIVMGGLSVSLTQNLQAIGRARLRADAMQLAEARIRELSETARAGELPAFGTSEGEFEAPYDQMRWQLTVEPHPVPLQDPSPEAQESSSIFALVSSAPGAQQPSVSWIVLRVFHEDGVPENAEPFVVFVVDPGGERPAEGDTGGAEGAGEQ